MATVKLRPSEVGPTLSTQAKTLPTAIALGSLAVVAQRSVARLAAISPVDMGVFKNAWYATRVGARKAYKVVNDAPYAGIIERGARPHPVSMEGQIAISHWVKRKIPGITDREAWKITKRICDKLAAHGQKGLFLAEGLLPTIVSWLEETIKKALVRYYAATPKGP